MHRSLADLNNDGRLTRDGFAVAFHLIQGKLSGKEIPTTLPASLMPPSMRGATATTTSPFQHPPSDFLNDLLREDSYVTFQPPSAILQPQRTEHTQSPATSAPHTQGQSTFGMSHSQLASNNFRYLNYRLRFFPMSPVIFVGCTCSTWCFSFSKCYPRRIGARCRSADYPR